MTAMNDPYLDGLCDRILCAATNVFAAAASERWDELADAAAETKGLSEALRDDVRWRLKELRREDRARVKAAVEAAVRSQPLFPLRLPDVPAPPTPQEGPSLPAPVAVMAAGGDGEVIQPCVVGGCPAFGVSARRPWRCRGHDA